MKRRGINGGLCTSRRRRDAPRRVNRLLIAAAQHRATEHALHTLIPQHQRMSASYLFWEQARPWVKSGNVQLRHIMVGVIREDSAAKAASLLADANPEVALQNHEQAGKASTLKAMQNIPKDIQAKLDANMKLMEDMSLSATPSIFYKDEAGHLQQQQGAPRPEALAKMMGPK